MATTANERLLEASKSGHFAGVLVALDEGADINIRDADQRTPLCLAVEAGQVEIIDALIQRKANLDLPSYADLTALHLAARDGRMDIVKQLLKAGAAATDRVLNDVIHVASMSANGKPEIVALLQNERIRRVRPSTEGKDATAKLISAAHDGELGGVQAALAAGADVNARDDRGMEALSWAALRGHAHIVGALVDAGGKINGLNGAGWPPLGQACGQGQIDTARTLIARGADVNLTFDEGKTALACAAHQSFPEVIKVLVAAGAKVPFDEFCGYAAQGEFSPLVWVALAPASNGLDSEGATPLTLAAKNGQLGVVAGLREGGANLDFVDGARRSALMFAAYQGHAAVVKYLLANGANVNLVSEADFTALDYAVKGAELECATLLQSSGAKLGDMASVMSFVCDQGHVALAKLVLSHRPPLDALDGNGVAPLHYAAIRGHLALAELLISAGARVNTTSKSGLTPLAMAKDAQQAELVALLERQGAS